MNLNRKLHNVPDDWSNPNWDDDENVCSEWRDFVDVEVRRLWAHLTDEMKQALSQNFNRFADIENSLCE